MKKLLKKRLQNEKGLTLVELLAVIVIIGIIAAIAIPSIGNIIQNSREKAVIADAQNVLAAGNLFFVANDGETEATIDGENNLIPEYLDAAGTLTEVTVSKTVDGAITISFTGTAGKKTITAAGQTSANLNEETFEDLGTVGTVD